MTATSTSAPVPIKLLAMAREKWVYQGARIALGYGAQMEGQRRYWFRREDIGAGGTTLIIPVDKFWPAGQRVAHA